MGSKHWVFIECCIWIILSFLLFNRYLLSENVSATHLDDRSKCPLHVALERALDHDSEQEHDQVTECKISLLHLCYNMAINWSDRTVLTIRFDTLGIDEVSPKLCNKVIGFCYWVHIRDFQNISFKSHVA